MAVNKIYQDSIIAGGSIRDGQGKRIDTTYAKKSEVPDAYTLPTASTTTLGGIKVDGETINIDSNGKIFSKAILLENSEDLNTLVTPDMVYYGTASSGCENLPIEGKSFNLQVLNAFNSNTDPAVVQQFISEDGEIYVRAYRYDTNWAPGGSGGVGGGGGAQPMGPEWSSWSKLATASDIPTAYTLPTASTTTLGGVKVDGSTITIDNGVISSKSSGGGNTPVQLTNENLNELSTPGTSFYADTTNTCTNKPAKVGLYSKAFGLVVKRVGNVDSMMDEPIIQQELTFASGETYTRVYNENDSMYFYTDNSSGMGGGDIGPAWSDWVLQLPCPSMVTSTSTGYVSTPIGRTVNMTGVTSNLTVYIWPANLRCYQYPGTTLVQANVTTAGLTLTVKCGDDTVTRYFNGVEPDISETGTYDIIIELFGDPNTISAGQLTYGVVRTGDAINFSSGGGAGDVGPAPIPPED